MLIKDSANNNNPIITMTYTKDFSVIIPVWRGAIKYLPKLFDSIPKMDGIEIIVVDNSKEPVNRDEINSSREIVFLHSSPDRHAGGSRNDGMSIAQGKWLIFADADDYFAPGAFDVFYSMLNTEAEIVYTCSRGVYEDTGEPSKRGAADRLTIHRFCNGEANESSLRFGIASPCAKMVSHALVDRHKLQYDEIRAGNDNYFSLTSGYYAKNVTALDNVTYIITSNYGSLTQRRDYEVIRARLYSLLHCNQFLKQHGLSDRQNSIMNCLYESRHFGIKKMCEFLCMVIKYRQNPFVGWKRWGKSFKRNKEIESQNKQYIVK